MTCTICNSKIKSDFKEHICFWKEQARQFEKKYLNEKSTKLLQLNITTDCEKENDIQTSLPFKYIQYPPCDASNFILPFTHKEQINSGVIPIVIAGKPKKNRLSVNSQIFQFFEVIDQARLHCAFFQGFKYKSTLKHNIKFTIDDLYKK